jgi:hypothetical protein
MHGVSRLFAERVLAKFGLIPIDWSDFVGVHVRRQFCHIDVAAVLEFHSRKLCLIIEDKVNASFGNDVEGYKTNALSQAQAWSPLKGVAPKDMPVLLFQTGFDYDLPSGENWKKFNWRDIWRWLEDVRACGMPESDILRDWITCQQASFQRLDHLCRLVSENLDDVLSKSAAECDNTKPASLWSHQVFQYLFFKQLFKISEAEVLKHEIETGYTTVVINRSRGENRHRLTLGSNRPGGSSWVSLSFDPRPLENVFYRLDWLAGMWSFSLRSYKHGDPPWDDQELRIQTATRKFMELLDSHGLTVSQFAARIDARETTRVLLDPAQGRQFVAIGAVHSEFEAWLAALV